ncbi:MAG TPA: apolipoprotein N-acyltransferase [Terriglobales bacterium]
MKSIHPSAWLLALSSGLLQVLVFPRPNFSFLCWVCIAPLIYAILRAREADAAQLLTDETFSYLVPARIGQGFLLGWVSGTVFYAGTCYWVFNVMFLHGGLPRPISAALLVAFSLYVGLHHGVFGALLAWAAKSRAGFNRKTLVLAPFLWVAVELLRAYVVSFPWDLLGTAQVDNVPLARIASVTGVYGISFEIALVNSAFAAAFLVRKQRRRNMLFAALVAAVGLQSTAIIHPEPLPTDSEVTLVQQNVPLEMDWNAQNYRALLDELGQMSRVPHEGRNPGLIVWPESPAPFFLNDRVFLDSVAQIARRENAYVIAGTLGVRAKEQGASGNEVYNSAAMVTPEGNLASRYDKVHLVPFGEYMPYANLLSFAQSLTHEVGTFLRGSDRAPLQMGRHKVGVFICYEAVFPGEVRVFADRGADVFVNISNDGWFGESGAPGQHLNMARMRAIENQRWLLRSTNTGITAVIDPYGRVVASVPRNQRVALTAAYGMQSETTLYTRFGDWFPILCAIISLVGLLWRGHGSTHMVQPQPV